jgi:hypothetical protein
MKVVVIVLPCKLVLAVVWRFLAGKARTTGAEAKAKVKALSMMTMVRGFAILSVCV